MNLIKKTEKIFDAIAKMTGEKQAEQLIYARQVANFLTNQSDIGAIDVDCSIDRTVGYFVPVLSYLSDNSEKQIAISTASYQQQQKLITDIELIHNACQLAHFKMPKIGFYYQRADFFSPTRTQAITHDIQRGEAALPLQTFNEDIAAICTTGSGMFWEYLDAHKSLPKPVNSQDVCLLEQGISDNPAYDQHLIDAKDCQLIITNHSSLFNTYTFTQFFDTLIIDEASKLPKVCEKIADHLLQIRQINRYLVATKLNMPIVVKAMTLVKDILTYLANLDRQWQYQINVINDNDHAPIMLFLGEKFNQLEELLTQIVAIYQQANQGAIPTQIYAQTVEYLEDSIEACAEFNRLTPARKQRAIVFSPNRYASIVSVDTQIDVFFQHRLNELTRKILFTDTAFSDGGLGDATFTQYYEQLNIIKNPIHLWSQVSPKYYGQMNFVVSAATGGDITYFDKFTQQINFDQDWINHTVKLINDATNRGRTLVFTQSFEESSALAQYLAIGNTRTILQEQNQEINEALSKFINRKKACFVTPDLTAFNTIKQTVGDNGFENIVITRLPIAPEASNRQLVYLSKKVTEGWSEQDVEAFLAKSKMESSITQLKVLLNQFITSPNDKVTVWFADPSITNKLSDPVAQAINSRFLLNYNNARVFGSKEDDLLPISVNFSSPAPTKIKPTKKNKKARYLEE